MTCISDSGHLVWERFQAMTCTSMFLMVYEAQKELDLTWNEPRGFDVVFCKQLQHSQNADFTSIHALKLRYESYILHFERNLIIPEICLKVNLRHHMSLACHGCIEQSLQSSQNETHQPATASTSTPNPTRISRGILVGQYFEWKKNEERSSYI